MELIYDRKGIDELYIVLLGNKMDLEYFRKGKNVRFKNKKLVV